MPQLRDAQYAVGDHLRTSYSPIHFVHILLDMPLAERLAIDLACPLSSKPGLSAAQQQRKRSPAVKDSSLNDIANL